MKISNRWYADCRDEKDKKERKELIASCHQVVALAREILEKELVALEDRAISESDYDSPSWGFLQADRNGAKRQLKRVIEFLTLKGDT